MVDVERWLSYKGTCHVILHENYMTCTFIRQPPFHINPHFLKSVSEVALLYRLHCIVLYLASIQDFYIVVCAMSCQKNT